MAKGQGNQKTLHLWYYLNLGGGALESRSRSRRREEPRDVESLHATWHGRDSVGGGGGGGGGGLSSPIKSSTMPTMSPVSHHVYRGALPASQSHHCLAEGQNVRTAQNGGHHPPTVSLTSSSTGGGGGQVQNKFSEIDLSAAPSHR